MSQFAGPAEGKEMDAREVATKLGRGGLAAGQEGFEAGD